MSEAVFTIGYQGSSLDRLIKTLAAASVTVLLDTRETPMSRRPEFRGSSLASALPAAGIRYVSVSALGAPKQLRALARVDWDTFADGYRDRLRVVRKELERILPIIDGERVCLFCFEADPSCCHRSLLAHEIERLLDVQAVHLDARRVHQADDDERLLPLGEVAEDQMEIALPR
jgi:uncharacterized protein (DUF488 family)